jgi:hypothetical protein
MVKLYDLIKINAADEAVSGDWVTVADLLNSPSVNQRITELRSSRWLMQNFAVDVVAVPPSRCLKCKSTARTPYGAKTTSAIAGIDSAGNPYTSIVWRTCACADCGQTRRDKSFEYSPTPPPNKPEHTPKRPIAPPITETRENLCPVGNPTPSPPLFVPTPLEA